MTTIIDLCCGTKSASRPFADLGYQVITVDIDPVFDPDIVADVRFWNWTGERPLLVWASPPCNEFAREFMPWCRTERDPDLSIVRACKRIIDDCQPQYWVIENVRGAVRWLTPLLGRPRAIVGPFFLWGYFPDIGKPVLNMRRKETMSSSWAVERAMIPRQIPVALIRAIQSQMVLI